MSRDKDYSALGLSEAEKRKVAIKDLKDWLGTTRYNKVSREVLKMSPPMSREQFSMQVAVIAGVSGYPVEVWMDLLKLETNGTTETQS